MDVCSLKVLEVDGSPSRTMLKLMGDQGCVLGDLMEFLQMMGHTDALQLFKQSGKHKHVFFMWYLSVFYVSDFVPSGIQILVHPQSVAVIAGHNLRLSCYAVGSSHVNFQWFRKSEEVCRNIINGETIVLSISHVILSWFLQVPHSSSPDLVFSPVQLKDAGVYICRVNCGNTCEFSHWAHVDVLNVPPRHGKIFLLDSDEYCGFSWVVVSLGAFNTI